MGFKFIRTDSIEVGILVIFLMYMVELFPRKKKDLTHVFSRFQII